MDSNLLDNRSLYLQNGGSAPTVIDGYNIFLVNDNNKDPKGYVIKRDKTEIFVEGNIITLKNIEILNDKSKKSIETIIANKGKRNFKKSWVSDFQARWWFGQGMGSYSENKDSKKPGLTNGRIILLCNNNKECTKYTYKSEFRDAETAYNALPLQVREHVEDFQR